MQLDSKWQTSKKIKYHWSEVSTILYNVLISNWGEKEMNKLIKCFKMFIKKNQMDFQDLKKQNGEISKLIKKRHFSKQTSVVQFLTTK